MTLYPFHKRFGLHNTKYWCCFYKEDNCHIKSKSFACNTRWTKEACGILWPALNVKLSISNYQTPCVWNALRSHLKVPWNHITWQLPYCIWQIMIYLFCNGGTRGRFSHKYSQKALHRYHWWSQHIIVILPPSHNHWWIILQYCNVS